MSGDAGAQGLQRGSWELGGVTQTLTQKAELESAPPSPANTRDKLPADKAPSASLRDAKYMDFCLLVFLRKQSVTE